MAELVQKRKITHILKISAQSEQLQQRYCRFYWFLKIACLRYEDPWGRDCVSGVPPCLVHSQNLSELIGHSDGGHKRFRTAVRTGWEERENAADATFLAFANVIQIGRDSFNVRKMATIFGWEQQKKSLDKASFHHFFS